MIVADSFTERLYRFKTTGTGFEDGGRHAGIERTVVATLALGAENLTDRALIVSLRPFAGRGGGFVQALSGGFVEVGSERDISR
jgi:hypothetical protein